MPPRRLRLRWTIRLRLTLLYGALFLTAGVLLLTVTYLLVAHTTLGVEVPPPARPEPVLPGGDPPAPPPSPTVELPESLAQQRASDLRQLLVASGVALALMTVLSIGLGWLVAGRALRPLRTLAATAKTISAYDLGQRLDVSGPDDEIKELAATFDGLLGRLERAFEAQRRFVANASHELRTPVTLERSLLEVALADPDATVSDLRQTCQQVLASNQRQEKLIEALLTLARSERGLDRRTQLDLAALAEAQVNALRREAASAGVHIDADLAPAVISGDSSLVERLLSNLIDNAIRHNLPQGWVTVSSGEYAGRSVLRVRNSGPMIPSAQVDRLFQPFQRLTRTTGQAGWGVGLSIVAAIATAHGAALQAEPLPSGGLDIRVSFRGHS